MRDEIADIVHRVFSRGLFLQARLQALPQQDLRFLQTEHAALLGMLSGPGPVRSLADFDGDPRHTAPGYTQADDRPYPPTLFIGIRYALACWLDEVAAHSQPWAAAWWEVHKMETSLYVGLNDRDWKFWEQAELAELRRDIDALEVAYLCVMLGFRGRFFGNAQELRDWRGRVEPRLRAVLRGPEGDQPLPRRLALDREPRLGYRLYRRMWAVLLFVGGALLFGGAVYLLTLNR